MRGLELEASLQSFIISFCVKEKGKFKAGRCATSDTHSYFRMLDLKFKYQGNSTVLEVKDYIPQARA